MRPNASSAVYFLHESLHGAGAPEDDADPAPARGSARVVLDRGAGAARGVAGGSLRAAWSADQRRVTVAPFGGIVSLKNATGSTRPPGTWMLRCRCGPVVRPVWPARPRSSPCATRSPSATETLLRWKYADAM